MLKPGGADKIISFGHGQQAMDSMPTLLAKNYPKAARQGHDPGHLGLRCLTFSAGRWRFHAAASPTRGEKTGNGGLEAAVFCPRLIKRVRGKFTPGGDGNVG